MKPSPKVIERKPVMTLTWLSRYWRLGMVGALAIAGAVSIAGDRALAQIRPDNTLGAESSRVTSPSPGAFQIDGGATRGANLFHSFSQFSVPTNGVAAFNNAVNIQNIISRVTGGSVSNIDGLLRANGTANLFLINPSGIVFGPNASLNIGGSFVASTANVIGFGNQGVFSVTNPESPSSLLTVNPSALLFNQITTASIQNNSVAPSGLSPSSEATTGLRVPDGKSLLLVGGDINIDGGGLYAFGGRVELGGSSGAGMIGLNGNGNNLSLSFPDRVAKSDVSLSNGALVDVAGGNGGSIAVNAQNLNFTGGSILQAGIASGLGSIDSQAGDIEINATEAINLNGGRIGNAVLPGAVGRGGDINITTGAIAVTNGAQLAVGTFGQGNAGSVNINARNAVSFDGVTSSGIPSAAFSTVKEEARGKAGSINITTGSLFVTNGAGMSVSTFGQGDAGNVNINAHDIVSFDGVSRYSLPGYSPFSSGVESNVIAKARGKGGSINITTGSLSMTNGAQLQTNTEGQGDAGSVNIHARDTVSFDGVSSNGYSSTVLGNVENGAVGKGGSINITTGSLSMTNGAQLQTSTEGQGDAGNVNINARDTVSFDGVSSNGYPSAAFSSVNPEATGNGGGINIKTGLFSVTNGAGLSASSEGSGAAGNIEVTARRSIRLDNQALLSSDTIAEQGNIFLHSRDLVLRHGSNITTNATGTALGGNISIATDVLAVLDDSNITANAQEAFGGRVRINVQALFRTAVSDITASSELGPEFSGTVELNTPDIDPTHGLVALPVVPIKTEVVQACQPGGSQAQSEFIITGRGGLPPNPGEALNTDAVQVDLVTLNPQVAQSSTQVVSTSPTSPTSSPIVEATGWVMDNDGNVVLTANAPTLTPHASWHRSADCRAFNQHPGG